MFEDATPEMLIDFFWDDEFRPTWDTMLASSTTVEECTSTGTMIVRWIRKVSKRVFLVSLLCWLIALSLVLLT